MIHVRLLPRRVLRWLRERKLRKWARIRQQDQQRRRARWLAQYLVSINFKSEFPR